MVDDGPARGTAGAILLLVDGVTISAAEHFHGFRFVWLEGEELPAFQVLAALVGLVLLVWAGTGRSWQRALRRVVMYVVALMGVLLLAFMIGAAVFAATQCDSGGECDIAPVAGLQLAGLALIVYLVAATVYETHRWLRRRRTRLACAAAIRSCRRQRSRCGHPVLPQMACAAATRFCGRWRALRPSGHAAGPAFALTFRVSVSSLARMSRESERRAAQEVVAGYHEARLAELIERVGEGAERFRAGEPDVAVDQIIFQYSRAAKELWKFCNLPEVEFTAGVINEHPPADWWDRGAPNRR